MVTIKTRKQTFSWLRSAALAAWKRWTQRWTQRWIQRWTQSWIQWRLSLPYPRLNPGESLGAYGERIASIFLERQGYLILERSYRQKFGEIDVIAVWQRRVVIFVEVKTWASIRDNSGGPSDSVDQAKQEKITKTALSYMKRHRLLESAGRADVIEVIFGKVPGRPHLRHFVNAFEAVGKYQMFS